MRRGRPKKQWGRPAPLASGCGASAGFDAWPWARARPRGRLLERRAIESRSPAAAGAASHTSAASGQAPARALAAAHAAAIEDHRASHLPHARRTHRVVRGRVCQQHRDGRRRPLVVAHVLQGRADQRAQVIAPLKSEEPIPELCESAVPRAPDPGSERRTELWSTPRPSRRSPRVALSFLSRRANARGCIPDAHGAAYTRCAVLAAGFRARRGGAGGGAAVAAPYGRARACVPAQWNASYVGADWLARARSRARRSDVS